MAIMLPLVTVLIPAYNSAKFLAEALMSVKSQVYDRIEVVVINDASTDETDDILSLFDGDLITVKLDSNRGVAGALNAGLEVSTGVFIARMDADDEMYEWRIWDQVRFLLTHPGIDFVGTGADYFGAAVGSWRSPLLHHEIVDTFLVNNPFIHPTMMFRRSLYDRGVLTYDNSLSCDEDYDLWSRLLLRYRGANLDSASIRYRFHSENNQFHPEKFLVKKKALQRFIDFHALGEYVDANDLSEFQCSAFVSKGRYRQLRQYALYAKTSGKPKLGWLQSGLEGADDYRSFSRWMDHELRLFDIA